ncbi:glycosyltransferase family 8 protein [Dendrothele bispora CBS 962.96]|uniref:Glycosyltransferase family 8 protein n=1 Tax=Dendrothele bispora (strain CBS 962.96) TaxID=1314807 RepID=A0A4S8MIR7_DENBC|nr:glycosyltransferase family 8 protein [Dendrothele bispora CBS 962.96]
MSQLSSYHFTETQDWFSHNEDHWKRLFTLITSKEPRVLEIGSWEGRSAVFLLNHLCQDGGEIVCIDHFDLFHTPAGRERFEKINHNLSQTGKPFRVLSQFSFPALMKLLEEEIAVSQPSLQTHPSHHQVVLRKTTEMRIGFLVENQAVEDTDEAMGYGINVVLTVDSSYALGAAVTMRSAVEATPGRITFYIVDCGLEDVDKDKLGQSVNIRDDVTMVFLSLPENALARELGPVWAKLDLHVLLPVERVLYLDSDTLVRTNLKGLWKTDLRGLPLAAVPDVGHPMGHDGIDRKMYFNAGVMLMDLAKIRMNSQSLLETGRKMKNSLFRDQDALNVHFVEWTALSLKWNAQGLGTYANYPSADRDILNLNDMVDPYIVHFTGPVHPTLAQVLSPYVQPPTAKPWGYLGSPNHPFQQDWRSIMEKTSWQGIRSSDTWKENTEREVQRSIQSAIDEFRKKIGL